VNHVTDLDDGIVESGITVTPELEAQCKEVKDRTEAIAVYHVNSVSNDNIYEAFEDFSWKIFEDIKSRNNENDLVDDLWDESIHVKQRKSARPVSVKPQ
jgi:hypothetical protein